MISTADRIACYLDAARIVCRYCGERAPYRFNKYPTVDGDHGELVHLARGVPPRLCEAGLLHRSIWLLQLDEQYRKKEQAPSA